MLQFSLLYSLILVALVEAQSGTPVDGCLDTASVDNFVPSDGLQFNTASAPYNLRLHPVPAVIAYPDNNAEVAASILCASQRNISITTRSGGHSYAAYSLGGTDGKLVIDLSNFTSYSYDSTSHNVKVGAGIRLGDLAIALNNDGRALPHGTCPTVGLGGHAGQGGYGFYSRLWGLTLDRIVSMEVALANGQVVNASPTENSDVFWAMRGAAASFGVITSFTLSTEPVPQQNVQLSMSWDLDAKTAAKAFVNFQNNLPNAPKELGYSFQLWKGNTNSTLAVTFTGSFAGSVADMNKFLDPQIQALPKPTQDIRQSIGWIPLLEWLAGEPLKTTDRAKPTDTFYAKSLSVHQDSPMSESQITSFMNYLASTPTDVNWFVMADSWGGSASVINSVALDSTAFGSRSNLYGLQIYGSSMNGQPPYPSDGISYIQGIWNSVVNSAPSGWSFGGYNNYVDPELSADQAHQQYFGSNYPRLQSIKQQVDPTSVFSYPQAVTP